MVPVRSDSARGFGRPIGLRDDGHVGLSSALGEGISAVWALHANARQPARPRYGLADGCAYLLFGFGAERAGQREMIHARVIGPRTRPFLIDQRPRLCVGVRIVSGFAQAAFGMPASELLDQRVDYGLVYASADADLERIETARTDAERVEGVRALARRRLLSATGIPSAVRVALTHIAAADGNIRIDSLARHIGVTRQHLARQFSAHVGMTAKQFARIKRGEAARARATATRSATPVNVNWSMIAHQAGYYDQAHFIRDFKVLTGSTPGAWMRSIP
jgi:AraC-like DNA-binding protein